MTTYSDTETRLRLENQRLREEVDHLHRKGDAIAYELLERKYRAVCELDLHERTIRRSLYRGVRAIAEAWAALAEGIHRTLNAWRLRAWDRENDARRRAVMRGPS